MNGFLRRTYAWSTCGVVASFSVASGIATVQLSKNACMLILGSGTVLSLVGLSVIGSIKCIMHFERDGTIYSTNNSSRILGYGLLVSGIGLITAPLFQVYDMSTYLPAAVVMSSFVMGGSTAYAYLDKTNSFLKYKSALFGLFSGLVGCSSISLIGSMIFGPNIISDLFRNIDVYAGIPIFAGIVAYDTQVAMKMYDEGNADHLQCSTSIYLDFVNILIRFIEIIAANDDKNRKKKNRRGGNHDDNSDIYSI